MVLARSLRVLLVVALLAAWQNALVHPIEHVDEAGALVHLPDGHGDEDSPDPLCDAIAALAVSITGNSNAVVAFSRASEKPDVRESGISTGSRFLAYRSQAPPQFS